MAYLIYLHMSFSLLLPLFYWTACGDSCCNRALKIHLIWLQVHHLDCVVSNFCWSNDISSDATTPFYSRRALTLLSWSLLNQLEDRLSCFTQYVPDINRLGVCFSCRYPHPPFKLFFSPHNLLFTNSGHEVINRSSQLDAVSKERLFLSANGLSFRAW